MTADELHHLANWLLQDGTEQHDRAAAYLRACANAMDAGPVAWRYKPMLGSPWSLSDDGYYISCKRDQGYIAEKLYPLAIPAQQPVSVADELPPAIPAGWKLVPVEPTPGMVLEGEAEVERHDFLRLDHAYRAMLAAAPTPPVATLRLPEPMTDGEISDYARAMVKGGESVDWLIKKVERELVRRMKEANK